MLLFKWSYDVFKYFQVETMNKKTLFIEKIINITMVSICGYYFFYDVVFLQII